MMVIDAALRFIRTKLVELAARNRGHRKTRTDCKLKVTLNSKNGGKINRYAFWGY